MVVLFWISEGVVGNRVILGSGGMGEWGGARLRLLLFPYQIYCGDLVA
jgi:hypothetical protein